MNGSYGQVSRRLFVTGLFATAATAALPVGTGAARPRTQVLRAKPAKVSIGARTVSTWTYDGRLPGPRIEATAGGVVRARLVNDLPAATTVHWHGIRLDARMDGAPGYTQKPVPPGGTFDYAFTTPDPGTYFYHSHVGMQNDRGLYGTLIVTDPHEPLGYDQEFTVVLDDWLDGMIGTPDDALRRLNASTAHDDTLRSDLLGGVTAELRHPYYLVNGRAAEAPEVFESKPGRLVRLRIINAAADTAFRVALGGHRLGVTHTDGFPCAPLTVDTILIGMGERYDVLVRLGDGAFPLVAEAEGKGARAFAIVRTSRKAGAPRSGVRLSELSGRRLTYADLNARRADRLPRPSRSVTVTLGMRPSGNEWTMNDRLAADPMRLRVERGETIRIVLDNQSPMWHPMHLHGHTFQVRTSSGPQGPRKDTVNVLPRERLNIDVHADNPGEWMFHCHNLYHQEQGMMGTLGYGPAKRAMKH
ncbi:Multicopper oxidase [[Actinomadura] parvosata subsp. kistnae]|uniref:Copper oxidase n=1 Tax=[Actinomadura] parvosata subsp. kistnae TaxID=1909395 RepID=A0A1V0A5H8_9ACTN|nr:copper oxidase [Nonomuraea sp. ATCC 55076]SPL96804.1 Multicopper oxidase [Actinomadura parvosata subsp. kistnae]